MSCNPLPILAQSFDASANPGMGTIVIFFIVYIAVVCLISALILWKVFVKAGKPGWASIVPIYNVVVLLQIAGKPGWWVVGLFLPIVNVIIALIISIVTSIEIARRFGKGGGFAVGLFFLPFIFYPILGFGSAQYQAAPPVPPRGFAPVMPQA